MKTRGKNVFWGLFFILAAVYMVVSKMTILPNIGVFSLVLTVLMAWAFINSLFHRNFFGMLFPVAIVCIVYAEPLGITAITPWPVLGAALLGSIGLSIIFGSHKNSCWGHGNWTINGKNASDFSKVVDEVNGDTIRFENNFGSTVKYINSADLHNVSLENNFGSMSIYFDKAEIQCGTAYVNVENNFGETKLYFPKSWKVENHSSSAFGSVSEKGRSESTGQPVVILQGDVSFGAVNVYYI